MARSFARASTEYLTVASAPVTNAPFALSTWAQAADLTNYHNILSLGDITSNIRCWMLQFAGGAAGDYLRMQCYDGSGNYAASSAAYQINTWHSCIGIEIASNSRAVWLDGGNKGTDATSSTYGTPNTTRVGEVVRSVATGPLDGMAAEAAIWDLSVWPGATSADKAAEFERLAVPALAAGYSPLFFPLGLVAYWPLGGMKSSDNAANVASGDLDIVGGYHMDPQATPSVADHPPIIYPRRTWPVLMPTGAPPGFAGQSYIIGGGMVA